MDRWMEKAGGIYPPLAACRKDFRVSVPTSAQGRRTHPAPSGVRSDSAVDWQTLEFTAYVNNPEAERRLGCRAARLAFALRGLAQCYIAKRNHSFQLFAFHNRQVPKAKLAHDEETLLNGFLRVDGAWICRHHFRHGGCPRRASDGYHAVHDVALGNDSRQYSVAHHR